MSKSILITGCAGFIGYHVSKRFLDEGYNVVGVDNINEYYDINLKNNRLNILHKYKNFSFHFKDIIDPDTIEQLYQYNFELVIHLAAQAGVRNSFDAPQTYIDSNIIGFYNILNMCKDKFTPFIYASSSSVYGDYDGQLSEHLPCNQPLSLYAATKQCNEGIAESYYQMYRFASIGLRLFSVYGPYGRPDMAYYSFTKNILNDEPIKLFNNGENLRDMTYIDDVVESIYKLSKIKIKSHELINIGTSKNITTLKLVQILEKLLNKKANLEYKDRQLCDVEITWANINKLEYFINYVPKTTIEDGLEQFVKWYLT